MLGDDDLHGEPRPHAFRFERGCGLVGDARPAMAMGAGILWIDMVFMAGAGGNVCVIGGLIASVIYRIPPFSA